MITPQCSNGSLTLMTIYRLILDLLTKMTFLVVPECIWTEEGFVIDGTHQPHIQMHSAHMWADCGM